MLLCWVWRAGGSDNHRQERKACVGLETNQADQPRLFPYPHPNPKPLFFIFLFFRGECVASRREPGSQKRSGEDRPAPDRERRVERREARRLQAGAGLRGREPAPTFTPRPGGRAKSQKPRCKLLKIISVLLNIRGRIQRSDLYRRVTRGGFLRIYYYFFSPTG